MARRMRSGTLVGPGIWRKCRPVCMTLQFKGTRDQGQETAPAARARRDQPPSECRGPQRGTRVGVACGGGAPRAVRKTDKRQAYYGAVHMMRIPKYWCSLFLACGLVSGAALIAQRATPVAAASVKWGYGGGPEQNRYSSLTQINRENVKRLTVAWTYDTGEPGAMQTQPTVVGNVLYGYTPTHKTFAINA